jgi:hypothetical protein
VDFHFAESAKRMEAAGLGRDELHVFEENGDHREARFLRDVVEAGLARSNTDTVAASALGKNDEVKFTGCSAKVPEFANASGIKFATFEEEANAAAEKALSPRVVPDSLVAENKNGITTGTPTESAEQNRIEQADVVADEKVAL